VGWAITHMKWKREKSLDGDIKVEWSSGQLAHGIIQQCFHQSSNGPVRTGTVQCSTGPDQEIFEPGSDQSLIFGTCTGLAWTALDQSTLAESPWICWKLLIHWVNTLSHTHTLIHVDSSCHFQGTMQISPLTTCHLPLSTHHLFSVHSPIVWCSLTTRLVFTHHAFGVD